MNREEGPAGNLPPSHLLGHVEQEPLASVLRPRLQKADQLLRDPLKLEIPILTLTPLHCYFP